jgi:large subunit ribosomal protein L9
MKVILRENLKNLGDIGTVVKVADGYARNYLLPRGFAAVVTEGTIKAIEKEKTSKRRVEEKLVNDLKALAEEISSKSYSISKKVGEEDKLYGSVTSGDIAESIKANGFDIDKKQIELDSPIASLGVHAVKIKLQKGVEAEIKLWVVKEEE